MIQTGLLVEFRDRFKIECKLRRIFFIVFLKPKVFLLLCSIEQPLMWANLSHLRTLMFDVIALRRENKKLKFVDSAVKSSSFNAVINRADHTQSFLVIELTVRGLKN